MPVVERNAVDFYGGPMDGHFSVFLESLKPFVVFKSGGHRHGMGLLGMFRRLLGRQSIEQPPFLAVYELQIDGDKRWYKHVRSIKATGIDFDPLRIHAVLATEDRLQRRSALIDAHS
ncbi:hypothetical protein [Rosistilla ulvae]|nr:hypothetical protein [Rosistilla ulvae]